MWDVLGTQQATNFVSLILVVITGGYVWLTYRIAAANSRMAQHLVEQQETISRPVIVANIEIRSQVLFVLVIRNSGQSVASDVRLSIDRDFIGLGKRNLRDIPIFQEKQFSLAPNDRLRFNLASGLELFDEKDNESKSFSFSIHAKYHSKLKEYAETIKVDLSPYWLTSWPKSEISEQIEKLTKAVESFSRKFP